MGMGVSLAEAFPAAREVFQEVDEALKQRLFKLMREGPESELTLTENAQPALMAVSLAALRVLEREFGVNCMSAHQAIVWDALRRCGINDRIDGFGRLFREF